MPRTWLANLVLLAGAGTGGWMAVGAVSQLLNPPPLGGVGAVSSGLGAELPIWLALGIATFVALRRAVRWHVIHTRLAWCCGLTTIGLLGIAIGVGVWSYRVWMEPGVPALVAWRAFTLSGGIQALAMAAQVFLFSGLLWTLIRTAPPAPPWRTMWRATWWALWRWTRRLCVAFLILLIALSGVLRVRSALLTRKIQAVVSGLQQLRIDASPEAEIRRLIPSMARIGGRPVAGAEGTATYNVQFLNAFSQIYNLPGIFWIEWPLDLNRTGPSVAPASKWEQLSLPLWVAYGLGWRHIGFEASVTVVNGVVSGFEYDLEPDLGLVHPPPYMVVVRSVHGLWDRSMPARVTDVDDETPEYRFGPAVGALADEYGVESIGLAYTTDAPRELVSHAFDLDLSCFWGLLGCSSARQVLPRLWADRAAALRAAASRFRSSTPCPDRILAGRVRRLPDLVVELREITDPALAVAASPIAQRATSRPGYRLKETILGDPNTAPWIWYPRHVYPQGLLWRPDPAARSMKAGDEVLVFLGVDFQSCRVVPATPSAIAAIRTATPAPRRPEDNIFTGRQ